MESDNVKTILQQLQRRNIKLIMDGFGTGDSSLSYLHSLPFDAFKMDKLFGNRMLENQKSLELVPAMFGMIDHFRGMTVLAEGVETPKQLAKLQNLNCDYVQGYLLSKAIA